VPIRSNRRRESFTRNNIAQFALFSQL